MSYKFVIYISIYLHLKLKRNHLVVVKLKLNSHNSLPNIGSIAFDDGFTKLLSEKYSPVTPFTFGFNAR